MLCLVIFIKLYTIKFKYKLCLQDRMMVFVRTKKIGNKNYYYLVEGKRDEQGKVKQKVLKYLGSAESILEKFKFWEQHHKRD